jgi:hypothetical protein
MNERRWTTNRTVNVNRAQAPTLRNGRASNEGQDTVGRDYLGIGFNAGATPAGSGVRPTLSAIEMSE